MLLYNVHHYEQPIRHYFKKLFGFVFSWKNSIIIIKSTLTMSAEATKDLILHPQENTKIGSCFYKKTKINVNKHIKK